MYQASNVYFICGFAAIGGGLFGFDISSMSGVLGTEAYRNYFGNPVSYRQGGITASMPAGSLVGSLASSFIADRYSRKVALQVSLYNAQPRTSGCSAPDVPSRASASASPLP
ncbi:hypothetical protein NPX13_g9174 [Xylaria arbuscula]|uniref:Major facilitator superfamily (MFS) profile domain-containing protein n=1 Tax=Xylaria arbuscula TaxID=114810 RepID=A0A9W8N784_9PEZI|nr:hypothetical protein NPX13_g9174 [Xylaria arbuscula]